MRDDDWKAILALYRYQNMTRAANALFMGQPTLTKQLYRMEQELGVSIVKRSNKGIVFTPEGEYLVQQAQKMADLMAETRSELLRMQGGISGTLKIGSSSSFARSQLPRMLQAYSEINPHTNFKVTVMISTEVLEAVRNDMLHVGFVNGDRDHNEMQVLCSRGTLYAIASRPFALAEMPEMNLIMHNRDAFSRNIIEMWWKSHFSQPMQVGVTVQDIDTSLQWIKSGLGYGFVFGNVLNEGEHLFRYPLLDSAGKPIYRNTWAIYRRDYSAFPLVKNFISYLENRGPLDPD